MSVYYVMLNKTLQAAADFTLDDVCLLEGILSQIWQTWCRFCRTVVVESCLGTQQVSGASIPGLPNALSDLHVSGAAISAWRKKKPTWKTTNSVLRHEPTWGDVDILLDIVRGLSPANSGTIAGMCTMASPRAFSI
jgi:hypothetical protein